MTDYLLLWVGGFLAAIGVELVLVVTFAGRGARLDAARACVWANLLFEPLRALTSEERGGWMLSGPVGWRIVAARDDSPAGGPPAIKRSRPSWSSRSDDAATFGCGLGREVFMLLLIGEFVAYASLTKMRLVPALLVSLLANAAGVIVMTRIVT